MILYYRTVTFLPKIKNNEALVGHCLKVLHGVCTKYTINTIGVSFPEWGKETIGDKISFISPNQLELDFLLQQTYFSEMTGLGYFNISDSTPAPEQCNRAVSGAIKNSTKRHRMDKESEPNVWLNEL
nr:type I-F CRISPR-associated endoribonuclease Cas6/Csy4 [Vibrio parahaemolyticus]